MRRYTYPQPGLELVCLCWKASYAGIKHPRKMMFDAVFWLTLAIRKISARLSGYGSITFRRSLEKNTGWNWQIVVQLRFASDYGMKCS
jgi:hypothetical protein